MALSSLLTDLALRLEAAGVVIRNTSLFLGQGADLPDTGAFVTLTTYEGMRALGTQQNPVKYGQPRAQLAAHADRTPDADALAWRCYDALVVSNAAIGSTAYLCIRPLQEPFEMGLGARGKPRVGFNVEVLRSVASA